MKGLEQIESRFEYTPRSILYKQGNEEECGDDDDDDDDDDRGDDDDDDDGDFTELEECDGPIVTRMTQVVVSFRALESRHVSEAAEAAKRPRVATLTIDVLRLVLAVERTAIRT